MQFKKGAVVSTARGEHAGDIDRVVMDPRTKEVTHLVVSKGFLFSEDRVIPIQAIASSDEDKVILRADVEQMDDFPPFEEQEFVLVDEREFSRDRPDMTAEVPYLYWYPGASAAPLYGPGYFGIHPATGGDAYETHTERNIPDTSVALNQGAKVVSSKDENLGSLEQVLTNPETDRVTHFVISQGLLFANRKLIPVDWIDKVEEDEVRLGVSSRQVERLPDYEEE